MLLNSVNITWRASTGPEPVIKPWISSGLRLNCVYDFEMFFKENSHHPIDLKIHPPLISSTLKNVWNSGGLINVILLPGSGTRLYNTCTDSRTLTLPSALPLRERMRRETRHPWLYSKQSPLAFPGWTGQRSLTSNQAICWKLLRQTQSLKQN